MKNESRIWVDGLELRENGEGEQPTIAGYAAVFNSDSVEMETFSARKFVERVAPGAFEDAIKSKQDVIANIEHEGGLRTLGRKSKNTLRMAEDDHGLRVEIDPPNTTHAKDAVELIRRGDIGGMSFAFRVQEEEFDRGDDLIVRTLKKVDLRDVTVTTNPAYPATTVEVRSIDQFAEEMDAATQTRMRVPRI